MSASDRKWDEDELMLPGFRFHPTDEELVDFYLRRKVENKQLSIELIKQVDIYRYEPWELPTSSVGADEQEWYFFCLRGRKYRNSVRPNRVTGSGFWKATGIDKPIYSFKVPHNCIGLKKSLVYYRGSAGKGTKTDWMMHEFRLPPQQRNSTSQHSNLGRTNNTALEAEVWTLCRIFKRVTSYRKYIPAQQPQLQLQFKQSFSSSLADSSSKTCSDESNHNYNNKKSELYISFADQTPAMRQQILTNYDTTQSSSPPPPPPPLTSSNSMEDHRQTRSDPLNSTGFWDASGDMMFSGDGGGGGECDWDELRQVVDPYGVVLSHSR